MVSSVSPRGACSFSSSPSIIKTSEWVFLSNLNPFNCLLLMSEVSTLKGTVHPKMTILPSFTHSHVIPNMQDFISSVYHKRRYFLPIQWKLPKCINSWNILSNISLVKQSQNYHCSVNYPFKEFLKRLKRFGTIVSFVSSSPFLLSIILMRN